MKIYVVNFNDHDNYRAYTSKEKAKTLLWESYCKDYSEDTRKRYEEEDKVTLEQGYIIDYGWISEVKLYDENDSEVNV